MRRLSLRCESHRRVSLRRVSLGRRSLRRRNLRRESIRREGRRREGCLRESCMREICRRVVEEEELGGVIEEVIDEGVLEEGRVEVLVLTAFAKLRVGFSIPVLNFFPGGAGFFTKFPGKSRDPGKF